MVQNRPQHRLLVIDDDPLVAQLIRDALDPMQFLVSDVGNAGLALQTFSVSRPRLVLLDLMMPGVEGLELLDRILSIDPGTDVILITGNYSTESAVEAIQRGAYDYLTKPIAPAKLEEKLTKWAEEAEIRGRAQTLNEELIHTFQFEGIIGRSPLMLDVFSKIRRIAPHFQTALVTGETGTGKELVARALHRKSPYANGPFITCNCAALPENLFESELFGHVRGAFTGAYSDRKGLVEAAHGGTLFLDEIGEIPLALQAKILRFLQNREIQRVGGLFPRRVDTRVIVATNRDLTSLAREKKFREDLYYRLSIVEITLPRLAARGETGYFQAAAEAG